MKSNIVIIGMGNMGRYHLQGISKLDYIEQIVCFDKLPSSLDETYKFCIENGIGTARIKTVDKLNDALANISASSIVFLATTAKGRKDILLSVIERIPKAVISEKPLCQNIDEYDEILSLSQNFPCRTYMNFSRHAYPCYLNIKKSINPTAISYMASFFCGGIACIGIHLLELATWLFNAKSYKIVYSKISKPWETKRKGFFDISGDIIVLFDEMNICHLGDSNNRILFEVSIRNNDILYSIFETKKKMIFTPSLDSPMVENIEIPYTSKIMDKVVDDIFCRRKPILPDINDVYLSHKILFDLLEMNNLRSLNIT